MLLSTGIVVVRRLSVCALPGRTKAGPEADWTAAVARLSTADRLKYSEIQG